MNPTGCLDHVGVSYPGFDLCDTLLRQGEIGGQPPEWKWDISPSSYFSLFSNSTWSSLFFIYHWHHQHYHSGEIFLIVRHGTDRAFWWKLWCAYITFVTYSSPQCFHLIPYMLSMLPSTSLLQNTLASGRNECKGFFSLPGRRADLNFDQIHITNIKSKIKQKFFSRMKSFETEFKKERRHSLTQVRQLHHQRAKHNIHKLSVTESSSARFPFYLFCLP